MRFTRGYWPGHSVGEHAYPGHLRGRAGLPCLRDIGSRKWVEPCARRTLGFHRPKFSRALCQQLSERHLDPGCEHLPGDGQDRGGESAPPAAPGRLPGDRALRALVGGRFLVPNLRAAERADLPEPGLYLPGVQFLCGWAARHPDHDLPVSAGALGAEAGPGPPGLDRAHPPAAGECEADRAGLRGPARGRAWGLCLLQDPEEGDFAGAGAGPLFWCNGRRVQPLFHQPGPLPQPILSGDQFRQSRNGNRLGRYPS